MTSKYTVVQFVPDPLADERLNVGVITWDARGAHARFLENWDRARRFGGTGTQVLREFASSLQAKLTSSRDLVSGETNAEFIEKMAESWSRTIQMTPPRGSTEPPDALLHRLAPRYLHEMPAQLRRGRDRRSAAADAYGLLKLAVELERPAEVERLVHRRRQLRGELGEHRFDVVLANGTPIAAVDALSFEVSNPSLLQRDVDAVAWALADVRKVERDLPLAVFALRPRTADMRAVFRGAGNTYTGLGAQFITDTRGMQTWSQQQAAKVHAEAMGA